MINDIAGIEIKSAFFDKNARLTLLYNNNTIAKASLLYGRNGTGKSTIAKAFRKIKGEQIPEIEKALLFNKDGTIVNIPDEEKTNIYVFDEQFVNDNLRLKEDGLSSIIMLGEQAGLTDLIDEASKELAKAEEERDNKKVTIDKYNDYNNVISPYYYSEKMIQTLRKGNGWADRKHIIEGSKIKAAVTSDTYKQFIHINPKKDRYELEAEYKENLQKLVEAKDGSTIIESVVPVIPSIFRELNVKKGNALLETVIEHPELSDREKYLLQLVQSGNGYVLQETANEFESDDCVVCPKCLQPLPNQYKRDLITSIRKVLSREVEIHQSELQSLVMSKLDMDLSQFSSLDHFQECIDCINLLNNLVEDNNNRLQEKIKDPYTPIKGKLLDPEAMVKQLDNALKLLKEDRSRYNKAVSNVQAIKKNLERINNEIAHYEIIDDAIKYEEKTTERDKENKEYQEAINNVNAKHKNLSKLNAKRDNINIAIDIINDSLKYVFFSGERIQIEVIDGVYKLYSNGHPVRPKDVSIGERNIIALCYYFAQIMQNKEVEEAYRGNYLLIIDDPISSYDWENRIGVLSFLKYQLSLFLTGNKETQALIMTHDLMTAFDIMKLLKELMNECREVFGCDFSSYQCELQKKKLDIFQYKKDEYTELLCTVYDYGSGLDGEMSPYIGNIMRQVLEEFGTFEYRKGINEISNDSTILATIKNDEYRLHYKNFMSRLILNHGSHREDQAKSIYLSMPELLSESDKRRTAREVLCFMFLLNELHMEKHLGKKKCSTIRKWCEENTN